MPKTKRKRRPGAGRKPLPPEEKRQQRVVLNFTDEEHKELRRAAGGQSASAFARNIVLRYLVRRHRRFNR
jgi:hypothetical protein